MNFDSLKYALKNLYQRKSRSFLTILSIFIGITTIFIFVSFGFGLYSYVNTLAGESGADKFIVYAKGGGAPGMDNTFRLEKKDLEEIQKTKGVKEAAGIYLKVLQIESNGEQKYVFGMGVSGTIEDSKLLNEISQVKMDKGRDIKKGDTKKVVLGYNYQVEKLIFTKPLKVGEKITINGEKFQIIGFYGLIGNPQDDSNIYLIDDDLKNLYPTQNLPYGQIIGRVDNKDDINSITANVKKNLRRERGQKEGQEDFFVQTFEDLIAQFSTALNVIIGFIILIALISVVVSAVNTANTMITSVMERTKEIGIMKSIGAKNSVIRNIFLLESSLLGLIAGIFGVIIGAIFASAAGSILKSLGWGFLSPQYSWQLFVALILFATLVGTVSGVTTAIQASKQNPVDALRYE